MPFVLALDAGTTSVRTMVVAPDGSVRAVAQREFAQGYPRPGWVEHNAEEIWSAQRETITTALQAGKIEAREIAAVGITNQRETAIVWERATGRPIAPAIVWQDRRTAPECDKLRAAGVEPSVIERTGLVLDAYFSATKVAWLLDNVPGARRRAEAGELAFGTVDCWLIWKLTGGKLHVTDVSNASRTQLYNIREGEWDDELLRIFRVPRAMLPNVVPSSGVLGEVSDAVLGGCATPIAGVAGDQQAALFGQLAWSPGQVKTTYGTGCFLLQNTGTSPIRSQHRLISTVAWQVGRETKFALEGSVFIGGAVVQWLRDGLNIIGSADEIGPLAGSVPDSGGVMFVPAFAGLGAPHWDSYARGMIIGLTRGTTKAHLARAALESVAFQVADVLETMRLDSGIELAELRVDGGATRNDLLMQMQADLAGLPVLRPKQTETTVLGAAYLAGLAAGVWRSPSELESLWQVDRRFEPAIAPAEAQSRRDLWRRAVERAKHWLPAGDHA